MCGPSAPAPGCWRWPCAQRAPCCSLFCFPVWGIRTVFLLIAVSPLLIYGYWFAFPQVLLWGEKPRYATAEWKKKHASVPFVLLFLELFLAMVFTAATSVLAVADPGRMFCLCALIGAALLGVCVLRIPRRLRNAGAVLSLVCCVLLLCWPLGYALNLACAGPTRHYEAQVVQQRVTFDEDDGEDSEPDYLSPCFCRTAERRKWTCPPPSTPWPRGASRCACASEAAFSAYA